MHCKPSCLVLLVLLVATNASAHAPLPDPAGAGARATAPSVSSIPMDPGPSIDGAAKYIPDRVLVQLRATSSSRTRPPSGTTSHGAQLGIASLDAIGARVGALRAGPAIASTRNSSVAADLGLDRWVLVELAPGSDVEAAVAAYLADPHVETAGPDHVLERLATPTDPLYSTHWGHNNTKQLRAYNYNTGVHNGPLVGTVGFDANAEAGWSGPHGFGGADVIIAILDTGVYLSHPDLTVVQGYDFGDNDANPEDDSAMPGHGTWCAGVAAARANNGLGSCGSAPGVSIMPMKVANSAGLFSTVAVANSLVWASDHGAAIASMSFGYFPHGNGIPVIDAAIEYAHAAGVVMLAGTGNNNDALLYPAKHSRVIGVGAASPCGGRKRSSSNPAFLSPGTSPDPNGHTCDNQRWWGSSFGPDTPDAPDAVDILAPTLLPTTDLQGGSGGLFNGVSCSTPYAAGVVALIKSKHPDWTSAQLRQQLLGTAQDVVNVESVAGWDRYSGYGMVDIDAAVGCSALPVVAGNGGIKVGAGGNCSVRIRAADLVTVSDPDGDEDIVSVRITQVDGAETDADSTLLSGVGSHAVRVTVTDYCGNRASASVDVHVTDTTPPSLAVVLDRGVLWPPNHRMLPVCATVTATDDCDADPDVALVSVESSEPENARGDGNTVGDIGGADVGTDDRCLDLRAERLSGGDGRWYTLVYAATDASGNAAYDTVEVHVPHDRPATLEPQETATENGPAAAAPTITALTSIRPNPFGPQTTVHFSLSNSERVRLAVYDVTGALVRQIVDATMPPGEHRASWDGRSDRGTGVPSGIYFVRMTAGSYREVRKIVGM